jgi:hypothetical protein
VLTFAIVATVCNRRPSFIGTGVENLRYGQFAVDIQSTIEFAWCVGCLEFISNDSSTSAANRRPVDAARRPLTRATNRNGQHTAPFNTWPPERTIAPRP